VLTPPCRNFKSDGTTALSVAVAVFGNAQLQVQEDGCAPT